MEILLYLHFTFAAEEVHGNVEGVMQVTYLKRCGTVVCCLLIVDL